MPSIDKKKIGLLIWFKFINKKILKLIYLKKKNKKIKKKSKKKQKRKKEKRKRKWGGCRRGWQPPP
jgi:hypothetical protein